MPTTHERHQVASVLRMAALALVLTLAACTAYDGMIPIDVRTVSPVLRTSHWQKEQPRIAVAPFVDLRRSASLGSYYTTLGNEVPFIYEGTELGEAIALNMIDYAVRRAGWDAWIETPDVDPPTGGAHVRVSGRIVDWYAEGHSHVVGARVILRTRLVVEMTRVADGHTLSIDLPRRERLWVWQFEPRDVEHGFSEHLHRTLDEALEKIRAEMGW